MQRWTKVTVAALPVAVLGVLLIVFLRRWCSSSSKGRHTGITEATEARTGIAKLHLAHDGNNPNHLPIFHHLHLHHELDTKRRANNYVFRRGVVLTKSLFSWADHPWLVAEAVEYGWSRFAFMVGSLSSPSTKSALLSLCAAGDQVRERDADISWEIFPESVDFMQKIRFNSGLKKINMGTAPLAAASSVIRSALPLPGPPLSSCSFPQEAYFEITILSIMDEDKESPCEGERSKLLIQETADEKVLSDSLIHVASGNRNTELQELKLKIKEDERRSTIAVMLSVGLTAGGALPSKLPGSYPGSIGFNSSGSVYLDGIKLVYETTTEKTDWGLTNKVIGCGFDPGQKKVFFTVDSELVHLINCKAEEFASPLYPTLAANMDVTVFVNFGQSAFKYAPANAQRTPNPCFIGSLVQAPAAAMGYEDSRELPLVEPKHHEEQKRRR